MPIEHLNGIDIYYERTGDPSGPRLLFVNGSGSTLAGTSPLRNMFADGFDLVAHDQRGLGRTSIPEGPYTMAQYAADAAALATAVGWETFRVVGVSFGGMVAQELAVTFPERIERLALVCTSPGGAGGASYPLLELAAMSPEARRAKSAELLDTRFTPDWLAEHDDDRALADMMVNRETGEKTADVGRGERLQLEARAGHDVYDRLPRITCPTFVACGRYDGIAPASNGRAIAAQVRNAELRVYEGGHAFFVQDRSAFPDIREFLQGGK
jgi:pimeloyl-ACP methyl ester carboxylesterase